MREAFLSTKGTCKPERQILTNLISLKIQIFVQYETPQTWQMRERETILNTNVAEWLICLICKKPQPTPNLYTKEIRANHVKRKLISLSNQIKEIKMRHHYTYAVLHMCKYIWRINSHKWNRLILPCCPPTGLYHLMYLPSTYEADCFPKVSPKSVLSELNFC